MDNNSQNSGGNQPPNDQEQPKPIFENVPGDQNIQAEEISADVSTPDEVISSAPPDLPPDQSYMPSGGGGNRNKFIVIGGAIVFFIVVLFLVLRFLNPGKPPGPAGPVTLTYWGLWEDKTVIDTLIKEYKTKQPLITVTYEKMDPLDYREKLLARAKNNKGPDIFRYHNTWLPEIQEVVAPMPATIMSNADFEKTFYPVHARDLKIDKYYYGIPLEIDGLVLIYNDALFKQAGIDRPPANWDELIEDVARLTVPDADGNIATSGIALGTATNIEHFSDIFGLWLLQNGVGLKAGDITKMTRDEIWGALKSIDSDAAVRMLEEYRRFAEPPTEFWNESMPNSIAAFIEGKVAMIIVPSWWIITIKSQNFDIPLKVAPVPQVPGTKPVHFATYWVEGVSRFSKNQVEAWNFLKFISEKDNMTKLYEQQSKSRLFGEPYSRVDLADKIANNEYIGTVIKQAPDYVSLPISGRTYDGGEDRTGGLNDDVIKYLENAITATINGVAFNEALRTAKQGIDQVYSQYKISQ